MAGFTDDSVKHGCSAWFESIRGSVSDRWTRTRNSLQKRRTKKDHVTGQPLTDVGDQNEAGSGDIVARQTKLIPRSPIINTKEDMNYLQAMISSLDSTDVRLDKCGMWTRLDDSSESLIDVDSVVDQVLSKALIDCTLERRSRHSSLQSTVSQALAERSSSGTSSKITDGIVDDSVTRLLSSSDPDLEIDLDQPYSRLENNYEIEKDIVFQNGVIIEVME